MTIRSYDVEIDALQEGFFEVSYPQFPDVAVCLPASSWDEAFNQAGLYLTCLLIGELQRS